MQTPGIIEQRFQQKEACVLGDSRVQVLIQCLFIDIRTILWALDF